MRNQKMPKTKPTSGLLRTITVLAVVVLGSLVAACSGSEPVEISAETIIVDVRSPGEYAAGHLDGAILLDLNSGEFAATLPDLDPDAEYIVYCRSGNRSGQAKSMMLDAGFSNVTDLGTVQNASNATGIPLVR